MTHPTQKDRYAIGTRAMYRTEDGSYRVVCATCDAGGTVKHRTHADAFHAAARDSNKPCHTCGAR